MPAFRKLSIVLFLALSFCLTCGAQGKVYTIKARLADFYSRTTKVVLSDDQMLDMVLEDAVKTRWRVSPYEFCSEEDYDRLKTNSTFYFLRVVYKDSEPGLVFLSLSKGGKTSRSADFDSAFDIIIIPFDRSDLSSGKLATVLPIFVDVVQTYAEDARVMEGRSLVGLARYNKNLIRNSYSEMLIADSDLDASASLSPGITRCTRQETETAFVEGRKCLVGIVVCPQYPQSGAKSYQYAVSADTHELFFFRTRPFDSYESVGFTGKDLSIISRFLKHADR